MDNYLSIKHVAKNIYYTCLALGVVWGIYDMADFGKRRSLPGDFNGDGSLDTIVVERESGNEISRVFERYSVPGGVVSEIPGLRTWGFPKILTVADFTGDHKPDILIYPLASWDRQYLFGVNDGRGGFDVFRLLAKPEAKPDIRDANYELDLRNTQQ